MSKVYAMRNAGTNNGSSRQNNNGGTKKKDRFQEAYEQGTRIYEQNRSQLVQQTQQLQTQLQGIGNGPLTYQQARDVRTYYNNLQSLTTYGFDTSEQIQAIGGFARQNNHLLSTYKTEKDYNNGYLYPARYQGLSGSTNTTNQLNGLRRTIEVLRQRGGDKARADALQAEYDWLEQHQYDYWTEDDCKKNIAYLEDEIGKQEDRMSNGGGFVRTPLGFVAVNEYAGTDLTEDEYRQLQQRQARNASELSRLEDLKTQLSNLQAAKERNAYRDVMKDWSEQDFADMEELARLTDARSGARKASRAGAGRRSRGTHSMINGYNERISELEKRFLDKGYSEDEVNAIVAYFIRDSHAMQRQKDLQELQDWGSQNFWTGLTASVASVPLSLAGGYGYVDIALQNATAKTDPFTGDRQRIDQYSAGTIFSDASSAIRSAVSEDMGGFGKFLYNTGMSMGDFLAAAPTGGAAELMLGGAAAMQATREAYARGASDGQALAMGAWAGASEAAFEHLSLGNLRAMKTSVTAARGVFRQILVDMAKQAGVEGSEELFTTISNTLGDSFIMGDKSALNTSIRDYMADGMSEEEATRKAYTDWANGAVMDFLGGALSGGVLGGGNRVRMSLAQGVVGRSILEDESGGREFDLINEALTLPEGTEARTFAEQLAKTKLESGDYTASEIGQLAWAVAEYKQTAKKENNPTADMSRTHPVVTEATDGSGATVMATQMSEIAESLVAAGDTHQEALAKTKVIEAVVAGDAALTGSQINKVGFAALTAPSTVEVIKQYTGVDITANGKTASAVRKSILAARDQQAERAAQIKAQGEAINAARSAVEAAVAQNDAEAGAKATAMLNEAQSAVNTGVRAQVPDDAAVEPGAPTGTAEAPVGDTTTAAAAASATPAAANDDTLHFSNGGSLTFKEFVEAFHDRNPDNPASKRELAQRFGELLDAQAQNGGTLPAKDLNSVAPSAASEKAAGKSTGKTEAKPTGKAKPGDTTRGTARGATKGKDKADISGKARAELEASRNDRDATKKGKSVKVAEGVEFAAREGGLQKLSNTQIWTGALVYRFLKNIGAKKVVFDAAYVGNANALIEPDGTIYINPEAKNMDQRGTILWALGHEIMHPATDGSRAQNPFAEKVLGTFEKLAKMGALKDGKLLQQVSARTTTVNKAMARYKKFYEKRGDTEMASRVDEHFASQEVAGDWMGAAFQSREIMELIARVDPSTLKPMQRAIMRMQELVTKIQRAQARKLTGGTGISIINSDADSAKEAEKILRDLAKDVNAALQKSTLNKSFKAKDKTKPKTETKTKTKTKTKTETKAETKTETPEEATASEAAATESKREDLVDLVERVIAEDADTAPSTRHMYLGENSKTADREALQIAQDFEKQGMNADQIRIVTGWFRGADGKWRYELADDRMTLRTKGTARLYNDSAEYREFSELETKERSGKLTEEERARYEELAATYVPLRTKVNKETRKRIREGTATLDDVLVHPELFEAYPELRQMRVKIANIGPPNLYGQYNPVANLLSINSNANQSNAEMRRTIAHEVQHAVQRLAGTAKGANPEAWGIKREHAKGALSSAQRLMDQKTTALFKQWTTAFRANDAATMAKVEESIQKIPDTDYIQRERIRRAIGAYQLVHDPRSNFDLYEDTAGEREARDTSARLERTADQRLRQRPDLGTNPVFSEDPYKRNPTKPPKGKTAAAEGEQQRFSISTPVTGMYNLSERVIGDMKQDKFGAASVVSMLRGKGVKAEEIKWLGIEDFLRGKKSVTKQELLDYIRANDLVIEETTLGTSYAPPSEEMVDQTTGEVYEDYESAYGALHDRMASEGYDEDTIDGSLLYDDNYGFYWNDPETGEVTDLAELIQPGNAFDGRDETHWSRYTTRGGTNYREILFKMPGSSYTNSASETHWRDEAPGVMAHARVQDFEDANGRPLLFIDEIQSDWHNEAAQERPDGSKVGYRDVNDPKVKLQERETELRKQRRSTDNRDEYARLSQQINAVRDELYPSNKPARELSEEAERLRKGEDLAGVRNNPYVIAAAKSRSLSVDYMLHQVKSELSLQNFISALVIEHTIDHDANKPAAPIGPDELAKVRDLMEVQKAWLQAETQLLAEQREGYNPAPPDAPFAKNYTDFVLKRLLREAAENGYDGLAWTTAEMQADRWSDEYMEGYRIEYDQDIPKFLNKFGKKFGARVGQTEINSDGEAITVPYLPITDEMRESIRTQGLPRFSLSQPIETTPKLVAIHNMTDSSLRSILRSGGMPTMSTAVVREGMPYTDFGKLSLVLPRETVDPEANPKNALFGGDSWTPTISALLGSARLGYHVDTPAFNAVVKNLVALCDGDQNAEDMVQEIAYTAQHFGVERAIEDYVTGTITLEPELVQLYMRDTGEDQGDFSLGAAVNAARSDMDLQAYIRDTMRWWNPDNPVGSGMIADLAEEVDEAVGTSFAAEVESGDYDDFKAFCEEVISSGNRAATRGEIAQWMRDVFAGAISSTPSTIKLLPRYGGRELPYNNENLAKLMYEIFPRRQTVGAEEIYFDEGIDEDLSYFQSAAVPEFKSVEEARQLSGRMENDAELFRERVEQLRMKLMMAESEIRRFARRMNVSDLRQMLAEMVELKTTDEVKREFFKKGVVLPENVAQRVLDANKAFAAVPQKYFEAKAERAVGLDELAKGLLVVPDDLDPTLLEEASKVFPSLVTYKAGDEASRYAAVNGPVGQGLRFSISEPLSDQLDRAINDEKAAKKNDAVYFGETPEIYKAIGFTGGPMLMWSSHLHQGAKPKSAENSHWHGITKEQYLALPEELAHPVMIYDPQPTDRSTNENTVGVVTGMLDTDGIPIVAFFRDQGGFQNLDLELSGATEAFRDNANAITTVFGKSFRPETMTQPTPTDAGYVDPRSFTQVLIDAKAKNDILYINQDRLAELEKSVKAFNDKNAPARTPVQTGPEGTGALPKRWRRGTEIPQSLYALPSQVILHKSSNLVKADGTARFAPSKRGADEPTRRYSVTPDQFDNDEEFRAFYRDLFGGLGLTERAHAETQADNSPPEREISLVRSNTLDHFFTATEKQMDELKKEEFDYDRVTEMQSMSAARERLDADYDGEKDYLEKHSFANGTDLDTAMGILSVELANARETGDYTDAVDWAHTIRANGTAAGQLVQAFAKYSRTPEGVLINAIETLEESDLDPARQDEIIERIFEFSRTLHDIERGDEEGRGDLIDLILEQAEMRNTKVSKTTLKNLSSGKITWLYDLALAQMDQIARDFIKPSFAKGLATFQTISHLFNIRTTNRNLGSNTLFSPIAAIGNNLAIIPDAIASVFTGQRYVGFDRWIFSKATWKGMREGGAKAWVEVALDVQPEPTQRDKYGTARRTWKMTGGRAARVGSTIEKMLGYELNFTDEFHKGGIRAEIMQSLEPMVRNGVISAEVAAQWAEQEALYRAFQDDTYMGNLLAILKNGMNTIGIGRTGRKIGNLEIKEFGLGDLVQKYTQVPGALFTRAVEFSPVGYAKCLYLMAQMSSAAKESKKANAKYETLQARADESSGKDALVSRAFRAKTAAETAQVQAATAQRMFALAVGRATTGTGLLALFATLALKGVLRRADDEDDPNVKAQNLSEGITGTQLNTSALARMIRGDSAEYQTGDHLVSVDWIEPINGLMTMGALIAKDTDGDQSFADKAKSYGLNSLDGLYLAFSDLPTMQTLQTIRDTVNYYDEEDSPTGSLPLDIAIEVGRGSLTGFIPSPVRQIAQATDPVQRDAYTSNSVMQQTWDQIRNSIPGLRQQLPVKKDNLGNDRKQEGGLLGILNATFLPGNIRTYQQSEYSKEMYEVYKATGDSSFYPGKSAPYSISMSIDGEQTQYKLDADQRVQYQRTRGATMYALIKDMHDDPVWKAATPEERAEMLSMAKNLATYAANQEIAKANGKTYTNNEYEKTNGALDVGYTVASWQNIRSAMSGVEGVDEDGDGKADDGTKKAAALQVLVDLDLTDEQKVYWYRGSSYAEETDKVGEAMAAGISANDWFSAKIALSNAHGTDNNGDGKTDSGSVQADVIRILMSMNLTPEQRRLLFLQMYPQSTKKANGTNWGD